MKKIILLLLTIVLSGSCKETKVHTEHYRNKKILVGKGSIADLQNSPYKNWFEENSSTYQPEQTIIDRLKPQINDYNYQIIMGTWCPDSREQVPVFYKILKESGYKNAEKIPVIFVPRKYKDYNLIDKMDIKRVPTLIVMEKGKEKGRIIEYPMKTIEKDLLHILQGDYKHELSD